MSLHKGRVSLENFTTFPQKVASHFIQELKCDALRRIYRANQEICESVAKQRFHKFLGLGF